MSEKFTFWICLLALVVALPLAFAVRAWENLREGHWLATHKEEIVVEGGVGQAFAGGQWKLLDMRRLPHTDDARVVLAELEVSPTDPAVLSQGACRVRLIDGKGRRFEPVTLTEPVVREMYPEAAERPRCGITALAGAQNGAAVRMAESFIVPSEARDLSLRIEFPGASDETLIFKWTRS
ncbi:hypothetical protein PWG15_22565 (plasmid) [Ensifer adhaerens]|uniref:hypothetical protein n=1 Tax=Ensifer adhaerens TaxID=106592 RepID=UPI0023A95236|nr:hypothetical protein [Ensifer adhaerens]WDZ80568.1 hypothetical protein PWG15_22565 [Ensifer adhaerens]